MSLGVLNNLSAMSAANNLNNTQNALSKTLQQLSSGSKINSGADDAAGLSLVNGLQANATALAQSQTNATEGVGLLTVADGALSQVTNLLNRAVTLATEVSNGTLNASQNTAANQEYQSILSEINNIGATTTYNQKTVFGSNTNIYVGDSSSSGASINQLNIRSLSSANVGDSGGQMSYSNGTDNVFIDLSSNGKNAAVSDSLGTASTTTTINVSYLSKGANGSAVVSSAQISVGAGTTYANTAEGLIDAINGSGLGITATFGTAQQAGSGSVAAATAASDTNDSLLTSGLDTGIIISGAGVGVNTNDGSTVFTNGAGEVGTLTVSNSTDVMGGTLTIVGSDGVSHNINLGVANQTDTLANLAATINAAGYGVTANINTTSQTTSSGVHQANTVMTLTSANSNVSVSGTAITDNAESTPVSTASFKASTGTSTLAAGPTAASTIGVINVNSATDILNGVLSVTGDLAANATNDELLGQTGTTDTLASLEAYINGGTDANFTGIGAALSNNGTTLTLFATSDTNGAPVLAVAGGSTIQDNTAGGTAIVQQTALTGAASTAYGTITLSNANDVFTSGTLYLTDPATGNVVNSGAGISLGVAGQTDTLTNLENTINGLGLQMTASVNTAGTQLTISTGATAPTAGDDPIISGSGVTTSLSLTDTPTTSADSTVLGTLSLPSAGASSDTLQGTLKFGTESIALGVSSGTQKTDTMADLAQTINAGNFGVQASLSADGKSITFTSSNNIVASLTAPSTGAAGDPDDKTQGSTSYLTWSTPNQGQTSSQYYNIGISSANGITDTSTGGGTGTVGISYNGNGTGGVATISYSDAAGQSLSNTDLANSVDAQATLKALNSAIADVAAQDGYVGAQINTLNAVSSVMATQQQNVVAAQNAVQATDYATAASDMSKYQILSQTGISALAQANSMQQEVLKLLQ